MKFLFFLLKVYIRAACDIRVIFAFNTCIKNIYMRIACFRSIFTRISYAKNITYIKNIFFKDICIKNIENINTKNICIKDIYIKNTCSARNAYVKYIYISSICDLAYKSSKSFIKS